MDGLSSGVGVLSGSFLAAILLFDTQAEATGPQLFVAGLILVVVGAAAGFWLHNWSPARLFMGDAGSYFLGFLLAAAALLASYTRYDSDHKHAILAPLFVMAVPLYDMLTVIGVRLASGQSPFQGDRNHFSHRLVDLGFSRPRAVLVIYLVTTMSGLAAFLLHLVDSLGAIILIAMMLCQFALVGLIELTARRTIRK
jgi:UDP-GlcNAc:undecaprenyl-phosphate GlcNAc-1-phosphate transferase